MSIGYGRSGGDRRARNMPLASAFTLACGAVSRRPLRESPAEGFGGKGAPKLPASRRLLRLRIKVRSCRMPGEGA